MGIRSSRVVLLRICYHEPEISFEGKPIRVHARLEFRAHGAEVHRILDDLVIAVLPHKKKSARSLSKSKQTLGHGLERDPQVA